jgi:Asp-tRNA(Asn)/Glu-tRNA(Gln) amidotransferase A subunit family amidase
MLPLVRRDQNPRGIHSIAFVSSNIDSILQAAEASTQRYKDGKPLGILDGVPLGVKDECDVAGYRTTNGRKGDEGFLDIKTETIWPVRRWEEAGAIVLGKLNMHELGAGKLINLKLPLLAPLIISKI